MKAQKLKEAELYADLHIKQKGRCSDCRRIPDWRGLTKHEIQFRSHGGNPLDIDNCKLLCGKCHSLAHGIKET